MSEATIRWVGPGLRMLGEANDSPAVVIDSSKSIFGTHSGATPMELLLLGLGGCTGMDVVSILGKQHQPVEGFEINIEAERADEHPKLYTQIHLEYVIYGDVDEKAVAKAIDLSETKYCSVMAMLRESAEIETSYRIEAEAPHKPGETLDV